jgi:DNA polymerase-4
VKVRTANFFTSNRVGKLAEPTTDPEVVAAKAREVFDRFDLRGPVRLLGVRVVLDD